MADVSGREQSPAEDTFSLLKAIGEASAVFLGLTFVAGWSYISTYYGTFGVDVIELDFPFPVVATIALHMLYEAVWPLAAVAAILALLTLAAHRFNPRGGNRRGWVVTALILVLFCCSTAALFRGRQRANSDMLEESPNLPWVAFSSKLEETRAESPDRLPCVAFQKQGKMECKLLLHAKGLYYFFRPIPVESKEQTSQLELYMIADSDVTGVHVQRGVDLRGAKP